MHREELVVLVDTLDREIGVKEKLRAHQEGDLHRAFSIVLFNKKGEMLLQQRAFSKYHSGGLWTNTCCSHPRPHEPVLEAAHRRLKEEMGIRCTLHKQLEFIYRAELSSGLIEHEFDHVFAGEFEGEPLPNPEEVASAKWVEFDALKKDLIQHPEIYTAWFKLLLPQLARPAQFRAQR